MGYSREDLNVELFASDKQHVLDLFCSKGKKCCYKFYLPSFGMAYGNPRFSELGKVLTKVALERSRMALCSPDWGAHRGNEYSRTLSIRAHLDQVPLNYPSETVVQPSSTAHFHYGFPTVEPLSWYSHKLLSSNLKTAIFEPS